MNTSAPKVPSREDVEARAKSLTAPSYADRSVLRYNEETADMLRTLLAEVERLTRMVDERNVAAGKHDQLIATCVELRAERDALNATIAAQAGDVQDAKRSGIYVASRVKHAPMWRGLRDMQRLPVNSTWIDEDGEGETEDFSELWHRIESEIKRSTALVLYVLAADFPLKGALIECGMALAAGVPVFLYTDAELEGRTMRPLGSWILDNRVTRCRSLQAAIDAALSNQEAKP